MTKQQEAYNRGKSNERTIIRHKIEKMLEQVKRLEIDQSSQVTLQELIVWLDERTNRVTEKYALVAAEVLQAECIGQNLMRM